MKAKMIWIAKHSTSRYAFEISLEEPNEPRIYIENMYGEGEYVQWTQYVMFEVESEL